MNKIEKIKLEGEKLIACKGTTEISKQAMKFLNLLRDIEFLDDFKDRKEEQLKDAQNLFGFHAFNPDKKSLAQVKSEVRSLIACVNPVD
jgi:hypothetical protein